MDSFNPAEFIGEQVIIELSNGRKFSGNLNSVDNLSNLVLESCRDINSPNSSNRMLGLSIIKGTSVATIYPSK